MRRLGWLAMGVVLGGTLVWGAFGYHVVRGKSGMTLVPKRSATLADTYIDVREWGMVDWASHPDLAWSLHEHGKGDVVGNADTLETTFKDAVNFKK